MDEILLLPLPPGPVPTPGPPPARPITAPCDWCQRDTQGHATPGAILLAERHAIRTAAGSLRPVHACGQCLRYRTNEDAARALAAQLGVVAGYRFDPKRAYQCYGLFTPATEPTPPEE